MINEATYFRINGKKIFDRDARKIIGALDWIDIGGDLVRLANGTRVSLRRPQFRKYKVTVSGESLHEPPFGDFHRGDIITVDMPKPIILDGDVADEDLPRPAAPGRTPGVFRITRIGEIETELGRKKVILPNGDPNVAITMFVPRLTIMLDNVRSEYQDTEEAKFVWSLDGEEV